MGGLICNKRYTDVIVRAAYEGRGYNRIWSIFLFCLDRQAPGVRDGMRFTHAMPSQKGQAMIKERKDAIGGWVVLSDRVTRKSNETF